MGLTFARRIVEEQGCTFYGCLQSRMGLRLLWKRVTLTLNQLLNFRGKRVSILVSC